MSSNPGPYYLPQRDEVAVFEQCHAQGLAIMLKGPTGCGKTRFVEHMAWRLDRPLVSIACHDDLSASDLVGRYLIHHDGTVWHDGPLTRAAREGAICYLDEVVEAGHRGGAALVDRPSAHAIHRQDR
jgi:nitric oxide reductase NorQ protein